MKNTLFLASQSLGRQELITDAQIPFISISHACDEDQFDRSLPFDQVITAIARGKMEHAILPQGMDGEIIYVLTADTMGQDEHGVIHGKPIDKEDAIKKLKVLRKGICGTAFCLDKKVFENGTWKTVERIEQCVIAEYVFEVPDHWIERYLDHQPNYPQISGAINIGGYGAQFLKTISGSYSTIVGLPMYEIRQALDKVGFFGV